MRIRLICILLLFSVTVLGQTSKLSVKGFGEIPVTKQGDSYLVSLGSYGQFALKGNLDAQELRGSINIDQLSQFPGFLVLSKLGLSNINLQVLSEGVLLYSQADTKGALEKLCRLLKITTPQIDVSVLVSKESAQLAAALEFVDGPVQFMSIAETGTSVKFTGASIATKLEPGTAELSVTSNLLIKPTKFDPDLESIYTFSYDLVSQTLTGSGSMMSDWANPLGTSQFLDDESIVFSNAAVELGINMATLAPVNLGLALERGKIFTLDFGVVVSIDPVGKEVAFMGKRDKMNVNDFTTFLREGFGLSIPNVLPDIYYIENPLVLFAPNGGSVGEVEIDKGIALKGMVKVGDAIEGPIDFSFDMENEFKLHMDLKYDYRKFIMNEVRKVKPLAPIANKILSTFQIRKLVIDMNANKGDMKLAGKAHCQFEVFGSNHDFSFNASLDPEQIAKSIVNEIAKVAGPQVTAVLNTLGSAVSAGGSLAADIAGKGIAEVGKLLNDAKIWGSHASHSRGKCDNECVPDMVSRISDMLLPASINAIQSFHNSIIDELVNIEGVDYNQTKQLRESHFLTQWNELNSRLDAEWHKLHEDKPYLRFYTLPSSAENGGNIYRRLILERKQIYVNYRNKLYENLINARIGDGSYEKLTQMPSQISVHYDRNAGCGTIHYFGTPVRQHCGWSKTWHTAMGAADKLLFYDNTAGLLEVYRVNAMGNMHLLMQHGGISHHWKSITWDGQISAIRFEDANGFYENYTIASNGNLQFHSRKPPLIELRYEKAAGCGTFLVNGKALQRHCGWSTNWHTALGMAGKALFYDSSSGYIEIYSVDEAGNMGLLKSYSNISKTWSSITWDHKNSLITFTLPSGYYEKYTCDVNGTIRLHSKTPSPIEVVYEREAGCGVFYREGRELKKHCGWSKKWHTVLMIGCTSGSAPEHKILFYDQSNGTAEIYKVDVNGNMSRLQRFDGFSKHWDSITWEGFNACEGLIKFQLPNGYWEKYECYDNGNINLHSKKE